MFVIVYVSVHTHVYVCDEAEPLLAHHVEYLWSLESLRRSRTLLSYTMYTIELLPHHGPHPRTAGLAPSCVHFSLNILTVQCCSEDCIGG